MKAQTTTSLRDRTSPALRTALNEYSKKYPNSVAEVMNNLDRSQRVGDLTLSTLMTMSCACSDASLPFRIDNPFNYFEK